MKTQAVFKYYDEKGNRLGIFFNFGSYVYVIKCNKNDNFSKKVSWKLYKEEQFSEVIKVEFRDIKSFMNFCNQNYYHKEYAVIDSLNKIIITNTYSFNGQNNRKIIEILTK